MSWMQSASNIEARETIAALHGSQAVIQFDPSGVILDANANFLRVMGYGLDEIRGKHHTLFVARDDATDPAYGAFWEALRRGEAQSATFRRLGKGGKEVWIEASYNPLKGRDGKVHKVVKFAIDVTQRIQSEAELRGQVEAITRSQAMIAFDLEGTILDANAAFLSAMGYGLEEIRGKKHALFMPPEEVHGAEYAALWAGLREGRFQKGRFRRKAKGGRDVWIEGAYNPILDANGRPFKVVKYAQDITRQMTLMSDLSHLIDRNFGEIGMAVDQTKAQAVGAGDSAQEAAATVQLVASSTDNLATSVGEIATSMDRTRVTADRAFDQTERAGEATARLVGAAEAMTGIVGLIQDIAGQINLLALNATIEAARAGEAGKGFAVVANEVKNLANQAAKATDQITREIGGLQGVSDEVEQALAAIRESIDDVRGNVSATLSVAEEQSAVTQSLSDSMQGGAAAVERITGNIQDIQAAMGQVVSAVTTTREAAEVLTQ